MTIRRGKLFICTPIYLEMLGNPVMQQINKTIDCDFIYYKTKQKWANLVLLFSLWQRWLTCYSSCLDIYCFVAKACTIKAWFLNIMDVTIETLGD